MMQTANKQIYLSMEINLSFWSDQPCYSFCVLSLETGLVIKIVSGFVRGRSCFFLFCTDTGRLSSVYGIRKDHMHSRGSLGKLLFRCFLGNSETTILTLLAHMLLGIVETLHGLNGEESVTLYFAQLAFYLHQLVILLMHNI